MVNVGENAIVVIRYIDDKYANCVYLSNDNKENVGADLFKAIFNTKTKDFKNIKPQKLANDLLKSNKGYNLELDNSDYTSNTVFVVDFEDRTITQYRHCSISIKDYPLNSHKFISVIWYKDFIKCYYQVEPITKAQIRHIHTLLNRKKIEDVRYRNILDLTFNVDTCKDIDTEQASALIVLLEQMQ